EKGKKPKTTILLDLQYAQVLSHLLYPDHCTLRSRNIVLVGEKLHLAVVAGVGSGCGGDLYVYVLWRETSTSLCIQPHPLPTLAPSTPLPIFSYYLVLFFLWLL
ncbi:hypothetical protein M758_2G048600, partial [Ceratodon purpureus]